jgi:hypothetical protein
MHEDFLYYLWEQQLFDLSNLITTEGERISILDVGLRNEDSGPDFFNAKIKIGEMLWVGNVEIHVNSSDWFKHKHQFDPVFDSVILHVVYEDDAPVSRTDATLIPTLALIGKFSSELWNKYEDLIKSPRNWIACERELMFVPTLIRQQWFDRVLTERLEKRSQQIQEILTRTNYNWEESFYRFLARSYGFRVNNLPFQMLAESIPFALVLKYREKLLHLESLFFGQAGFLAKNPESPYENSLQKSFQLLSQKHSLTPLPAPIWKFNRLRPYNFPTLRIAQFVMLWYRHERLFYKLIAASSLEDLYRLLDNEASDFWYMHYTFNISSDPQVKKTGRVSIENLIINCIAPFAFYYGKFHQQLNLCNKALSWLEALPAENNSITRNWERTGQVIPDAACAQALIHLKKEYCDLKKCVNCGVGQFLIKQA